MSTREIHSISPISRRVFLRGAGVAVALPWLESLPVWGGASITPEGQTPPKRFVVQFMGTGISPGNWWAKGEGAQMELGPSLTPLEPFKAKMNVIDRKSVV